MAEDVSEPPLMKADETLSPVDLPGAPEEAGLLWTSVVIATATLLLLIANAATIDDWARELPPSPAAERVTALTGRWAGITASFGVPRALFHAQWKKAETARFN